MIGFFPNRHRILVLELNAGTLMERVRACTMTADDHGRSEAWYKARIHGFQGTLTADQFKLWAGTSALGSRASTYLHGRVEALGDEQCRLLLRARPNRAARLIAWLPLLLSVLIVLDHNEHASDPLGGRVFLAALVVFTMVGGSVLWQRSDGKRLQRMFDRLVLSERQPIPGMSVHARAEPSER